LLQSSKKDVDGRDKPGHDALSSGLSTFDHEPWNSTLDSSDLDPTDEDEPADEMSLVEARLEYLAEVAERCRKIILASKLAIAAGAGLLLVMVLGLIGPNDNAAIGSIAVVLGGIVSLGSNVSTLRQTMDAISDAEALRSDMIDRKHLRLVGGTDIEPM